MTLTMLNIARIECEECVPLPQDRNFEIKLPLYQRSPYHTKFKEAIDKAGAQDEPVAIPSDKADKNTRNPFDVKGLMPYKLVHNLAY